jgi:hypothetical protein
MKQYTNAATFVVIMAAASISLTRAILVQPYNYMLDDSSMVSGQQDSGSLSPYLNDQSGSNEHNSDKDIVSIIGDGLARLRLARNLDNPEEVAQNQGHLSQEMADLIQSEQQAQSASNTGKQEQEQSLSSSVANMLLNVAQAAAQASVSASAEENQQQQQQQNDGSNSQSGGDNRDVSMSSRGSITEFDTSPSSSSGATSTPSKADLKSVPTQWFNPKETIPVLKISSMGKLGLI